MLFKKWYELFLFQRLVQVLGRQYQNDLEEKLVFVLTSNSLQKWLLIKDEPDKMFYSCDLETLSKQSFVNSGQWVSLLEAYTYTSGIIF